MIPVEGTACRGLVLPSFPPRIADLVVPIAVGRAEGALRGSGYLQGKPGPAASLARDIRVLVTWKAEEVGKALQTP